MRRSRPRSPWIPLLFLAAAFWISARTPTPTAAESPGSRTLLVLGDSLAAGYGLDPSVAFPALIQKKAEAEGIPLQVVNGGVSGDTTAGGLRRLDWLLRRPVDVLLLELGGNDGLRGLSPGATRTNLTAIIRKTREKNPAVAVVVAGMQMPPNMGETYADEFREVFPRVAREERTTLMPFLLKDVGGVPELNQPDQIHPTAAGHALIASNLWVVLEPVLKSLPPRPGKN